MKKKIIIAGSIVIIILFLCGCYYFSFRTALLHYNQKKIEQNTELLNQLLQYSDASKRLLEEIISDNSINEEQYIKTLAHSETTGADTSYFLETYQLKNGVMHREKLPIPGFMVGLNREEMITYVNGFMEYLPINEYLEGLVSYEVISFSADSVTLRKSYDEDKVKYQFYICFYNENVTVYYSDLKTVFEYTDISYEALPAAMRERIKEGYYIKDTKELYGVLESLTS